MCCISFDSDGLSSGCSWLSAAQAAGGGCELLQEESRLPAAAAGAAG